MSRLWGSIHEATALEIIQKFNGEYKYIKFTYDSDERDIDVEYDFLPSSEVGKEIIELIDYTVATINEIYPYLQKNLLGEVSSTTTSIPEKNNNDEKINPMVHMLSNIETLCNAFVLEHDKADYIISKKLILGLNIPENAEIYLGHDDTIFKNGKNGFAITSEGIFCRVVLENSELTTYKQLALANKIYWKDAYLYVGNNKVAYHATASKREKIIF